MNSPQHLDTKYLLKTQSESEKKMDFVPTFQAKSLFLEVIPISISIGVNMPLQENK